MSLSLSDHGIHVENLIRNPHPPALYEAALRHEKIAERGD